MTEELVEMVKQSHINWAETKRLGDKHGGVGWEKALKALAHQIANGVAYVDDRVGHTVGEQPPLPECFSNTNTETWNIVWSKWSHWNNYRKQLRNKIATAKYDLVIFLHPHTLMLQPYL